MEQGLRDRLFAVVTACRGHLEADVRRQLERTFGVLPDGRVLGLKEFTPAGDPDYLGRRARILDAVGHLEQTFHQNREAAVAQFTREVAFTALNRLAALKLMEHPSRALVRESVGKGRESAGFRQFARVCPGLCREAVNNDTKDGGYRLYLECLFDDLATELGVLFDRGLPQALIFPSDLCLREVFEQLNTAELAPVWGSDETIGWVYQYFTPQEHRREIRKAAAPQNAYEMACRNQFYTPRYVVRFLAENTLGRMWYEMRHGRTALADPTDDTIFCKYLVRLPNEQFLGAGEPVPEPTGEPPASPQERLRATAYIAFRARKDPRDLKILDPACGSGHFLLYVFDLLLTIYKEAWDDPGSPTSEATGKTLREDYPDAEALARAIPGLILKHNLFGIDIDLRATQIAALALWLRAQRALQELGLKITERPRITRTNIVCAEPMPGTEEERDTFTTMLQPPVLGQLVDLVFRDMELAGEAGALLEVEQELRAKIAKARTEAAKVKPTSRAAQPALFAAPRGKREFDPSGVVNDDQFWNGAFERVVDALREFAEDAPAEQAYRRKLFADDAARGFAFVDVCRHTYDVVLMNPPFGDTNVGAKVYVDEHYPRGKDNILAAFVERGVRLLRTRGMLGAITSRTPFFLISYQKWREEVVLGLCRPTVFADLGDGVLDKALVEAAAYCLEVARP